MDSEPFSSELAPLSTDDSTTTHVADVPDNQHETRGFQPMLMSSQGLSTTSVAGITDLNRSDEAYLGPQCISLADMELRTLFETFPFEVLPQSVGGPHPCPSGINNSAASQQDLDDFLQLQLHADTLGIDRSLGLAQRSLSFVSACLQPAAPTDDWASRPTQSSALLLTCIYIVQTVHTYYTKLVASSVPTIGDGSQISLGNFQFSSDSSSYKNVLAVIIDSEIRRCDDLATLLRHRVSLADLSNTDEVEELGSTEFSQQLIASFLRCLEKQVQQREVFAETHHK